MAADGNDVLMNVAAAILLTDIDAVLFFDHIDANVVLMGDDDALAHAAFSETSKNDFGSTAPPVARQISSMMLLLRFSPRMYRCTCARLLPSNAAKAVTVV